MMMMTVMRNDDDDYDRLWMMMIPYSIPTHLWLRTIGVIYPHCVITIIDSCKEHGDIIIIDNTNK